VQQLFAKERPIIVSPSEKKRQVATSCIDPAGDVLYLPVLNETLFTGEIDFLKMYKSAFRLQCGSTIGEG